MPVVPITEADAPPSSFRRRQRQTAVLMITPDGYHIGDHINPHMRGTADDTKARVQWDSLRDAYAEVTDVYTIDAAAYAADDEALVSPTQLPDMVFAANQTLVDSQDKQVILSNMATDQRVDEVPYFERFFSDHEWRTRHLPDNVRFEGAGDAIWHPNRDLLWGGYGIRSDQQAYEHIAEMLDTTIYTIELTDDTYYHLDTCYMPLDEETVLVAPDAFSDTVMSAIERLWKRVLVAPVDEANNLSCNVHAVNDDLIFTGSDAPSTRQLLEDAGYTVRTFELSEFQKAGGSVFCLRQNL